MAVLRDDDDLYEEERRRRAGRGLRRRNQITFTEEVTAASLQSRAEMLREELMRIQEDLAKLNAEPDPPAGT